VLLFLKLKAQKQSDLFVGYACTSLAKRLNKKTGDMCIELDTRYKMLKKKAESPEAI